MKGRVRSSLEANARGWLAQVTTLREDRRSAEASFRPGSRSKPTEPQAGTASKQARAPVPPAALRLLTSAAVHQHWFVMKHYAWAGCGPRVGRRMLEECEGRGLMRRHALVRVGRGSKPEVLEVTPAGAEVLQACGLGEPVRLRGRGSFPHAVYCRLLAESQAFLGLRVSFEVKHGSDPSKVFDALGRSAHGGIVAGEVLCSGSVDHNAKAMRRALSVPGIDKLIIAGDDAKLLQRVEDRLQADGALLQRADREVVFLFLGEVTVAALRRERLEESP